MRVRYFDSKSTYDEQGRASTRRSISSVRSFLMTLPALIEENDIVLIFARMA